MTTLEDVFLKINQEFAPELFGFDPNSKVSDSFGRGSVLPKSPTKWLSIAHSTEMSSNQ